MSQKLLMSKVFAWMFVGLLVTFLTGYVVSLNPNMILSVFESGWLWALLIGEIVLVIFLSAKIFKMKPITAKISFLLYSFISGLTFSSYFIVYDVQSVMYVFLITSLIFGLFALIGAKTKVDLSKFGTILMMALLSVLLCFIINIFFNNATFDLVLSIIVILVFIGFTAYDTQKILSLKDAGLPEDNLAIFGALQLYLDFINLFIELLRIFGNNNND